MPALRRGERRPTSDRGLPLRRRREQHQGVGAALNAPVRHARRPQRPGTARTALAAPVGPRRVAARSHPRAAAVRRSNGQAPFPCRRGAGPRRPEDGAGARRVVLRSPSRPPAPRQRHREQRRSRRIEPCVGSADGPRRRWHAARPGGGEAVNRLARGEARRLSAPLRQGPRIPVGGRHRLRWSRRGDARPWSRSADAPGRATSGPASLCPCRCPHRPCPGPAAHGAGGLSLAVPGPRCRGRAVVHGVFKGGGTSGVARMPGGRAVSEPYDRRPGARATCPTRRCARGASVRRVHPPQRRRRCRDRPARHPPAANRGRDLTRSRHCAG